MLQDQDEALKQLAQRCAVAEYQLRDRGKRPWAQVDPASDVLQDAWRAHGETWHLLNVPSGDRLKLRRKDRAAVSAALTAVADVVFAELEKLATYQYDFLNTVVTQAVAEIGRAHV